MQHRVTALHVERGRVTSVCASAPTGERRFTVDHVISTTAVRSLVRALRPEPPEGIRAAAEGLRYRDFLVVALILKGEDAKLIDAIKANYNEGMVDFNENLRQLVELGRIDKATALEFSPNADQLRMMLKGIKFAQTGLV